jgi:hypothetical protein
MKLSKDKRDKFILTCLAFIGATGILYTFVLGAQKDTLAGLNKQILIGRDKLGKAERLLKNKATIEADLQAHQQVLTTREQSLAPQGQYYYWFLKLMDQFREQERLNSTFITDITQPEFNDAGLVANIQYKAASFGLRLNGQYQEIGRFIADLENTFPYFRVQNVRMVPQTPGIAAASAVKQTTLAPAAEGTLIVELRVVTLIRGGTT